MDPFEDKENFPSQPEVQKHLRKVSNPYKNWVAQKIFNIAQKLYYLHLDWIKTDQDKVRATYS